MAVPPPERVERFKFTPRRVNHPVVRFLGSLRFGLTILALILIASSIGEFLPAEPPDNNWAFDFVFRTWWFRALLFTQAVNLLINTYMTWIEETRAQFLPIYRDQADAYKPLKIRHKSTFKQARAENAESLTRSLAEALHRRGYRVFYGPESVYAHRGLVARFGSTVTHLGLIVILSGALAESIFKVEGQIFMTEGEAVRHYTPRLSARTERGLIFIPAGVVEEAELRRVAREAGAERVYPLEGYYQVTTAPEALETVRRSLETRGLAIAASRVGAPNLPLGLEVLCRDFEFSQYPGSETAAKFKSTVTIEVPGKPPIHDFIRVNHDVTHGGWTFHQEAFLTPTTEGGEFLADFQRYYVRLAEALPDGRSRTAQLELNLEDFGPAVAPLPGHGDRFLALERDSTGRGVIWSVASKERLLARGVKSLLGEPMIELVRFFPHYDVDENGWHVNRGDEPVNPAALVEVSTNNRVAARGWVFYHPQPRAEANPLIDHLMMLDYEVPAAEGALAPAGGLGNGEGAALASGGSGGPSIEDRVIVTLAVKNKETGRPVGRPIELVRGRSVPFLGELDAGLEIDGPYRLEAIHRVDALATIVSVSKNPGIPVVWLGAIFASTGPVLAFFVSRRRVWAHVDWARRQVWLGGDSRYSREALEDELAEVAAAWSRSEPVQLDPPIKMPIPGAREDRLSRHL